jgi:hypothetical protein
VWSGWLKFHPSHFLLDGTVQTAMPNQHPAAHPLEENFGSEESLSWLCGCATQNTQISSPTLKLSSALQQRIPRVVQEATKIVLILLNDKSQSSGDFRRAPQVWTNAGQAHWTPKAAF